MIGFKFESYFYLNSKVDESTDVERVFHEVKDELNVLDEGQVVGHPQVKAGDLLQDVSGHLNANQKENMMHKDE